MTSENKVFEYTDIEKLIPHRAPFLLIDKLTNAVPGESATGIKAVSGCEPYFAGHFPGNPVMPGVLIVEHKLGFVHANAGIDQSNIALDGVSQEELCLLLPKDPDASAHALKTALEDRYQCRLGVIINDSVGRAWRMGTVGLAIGVAGLTALEDYIGESDIYGAELKVTQVAAADELAAGASIVMGQTTERVPLVLIRGYEGRQNAEAEALGVKPLIRPKQMDMFR